MRGGGEVGGRYWRGVVRRGWPTCRAMETLGLGPQRGRRAEESWAPQGLVWDYDSRGKHDFIGEFSTTFEEMQKAFGDEIRIQRKNSVREQNSPPQNMSLGHINYFKLVIFEYVLKTQVTYL